MGLEGKPTNENIPTSQPEESVEDAPSFRNEPEWKDQYGKEVSYFLKNKTTFLIEYEDALAVDSFEDVLERVATDIADKHYLMKQQQKKIEANIKRNKNASRGDALEELNSQISNGDPITAEYAERAKKLLEDEE